MTAEMQTSNESRIREMQDLIRNGQYSEVENVWMEAVNEGVSDARPFIALSNSMSKAGHGPKASSLLELLSDALIKGGNPEEACAVVVHAAELDPNNRGLKDAATRAYSVRFTGVDGFDDVLLANGETFSDNPGGFVRALHDLCSYKVGDYLFHDAGWGLGKVVGLQLRDRKLLVNFKEAEGHEVDLASATQFFRKLPATHLLSRMAEDTDAVKEEANSSPVTLLRCALRSLEGKVTLRRIKDVLSPEVISKSAWAKWWTGAKKAIAQDGSIKVGAGANPTLELLHVATTIENTFADRLAACHTSADYARTLYAYIAESSEGPKRTQFLSSRMQLLFDRLSSREMVSDGEKMLAKFLLDDVRAADPGVTLSYELDVRAICADEARILKALPELSLPAYEQRALDTIKEIHPNWSGVLSRALLVMIPNSWDSIVDDLRAADKTQELFAITRKVYEAGHLHPDQQMWLIRKAVTEGSPADLGLEVNPRMAIIEYLRLGMHIFQNLEKKDRRAKNQIQKFRNILSERNNRMIQIALDGADLQQGRHLLHSVRLNRALSEARIDVVVTMILERFPELAGEDAVEAVNPEEQGEILTTPAGYDNKRHELSDIVNEQIPALQRLIEETVAQSDDSENAEVDAARSKEEALRTEALRVSADLERARIVEPEEVDASAAGFGTKVTLRNTASNEVEVFTILGRWDYDTEKRIISDNSAIGRGVEGMKRGETRSFQTPDGTTVSYELTAIEPAKFEGSKN